MGDYSRSATTRTVSVRFILDGEIIELHDVDPTRTVLQLLREDLHRTGTKEGCAEGDCGACMVVLAELDRSGKRIEVRAINSCIQFIPMLDGKELITVESLADVEGGLHPVQQALVDTHASQCGFCTPGFVMSLFATFKTQSNPTRREIVDTLSGNLCRCTGYRPIIDAAHAMYELPAKDGDWLQQQGNVEIDDASRVKKLQSINRVGSLQTGSNGHHFFAPVTLEELIALRQQYPQATLIAGGTDVGLWVTKQYRNLGDLIYTGRVPELLYTGLTNDCIEIGAAVSITEAGGIIIDHYPELEELFVRFASPPIRNVATLGGNIANGSPIGDSMPPLIALEARIVLQGASGARELLLEDFYQDYMVKDLRPDEILTTIKIPLPDDTSSLRTYKVSKRFDQDISALCMAFCVQLDNDVVKSIRVACGGLAAIPKRAVECEAALIGQVWNADTISRGIKALGDDFSPIDDMRASAAYRFRCAQNLLRRFYLETTQQLEHTVYDYER
jgi:xanthine dehydrogenase small subunit